MIAKQLFVLVVALGFLSTVIATVYVGTFNTGLGFTVEFVGSIFTVLMMFSVILKYSTPKSEVTFRGKPFKVRSIFSKQVKLWLIFNLLTFPFIALFYIPYNVFWLQYSTIQLLRWVLTAGVFASVFNLFNRPYVAWVTRVLERRYGKKAVVGKMDTIVVKSDTVELLELRDREEML